MVGIIEYGSGNINAIERALKFNSIPYMILRNPTKNVNLSHLILPGVGDFDETIILLKNRGWFNWLNTAVLTLRVPILGICVGMQIMFEKSEEGKELGFGWIKGSVTKISSQDSLPLPHMGWNSVKSNHQLMEGISKQDGFYFLHSFKGEPEISTNVIAESFYKEKLPVAVLNKNILGVQFHPEKSLSNGTKLFANFYNFFSQ